MLFQVVEEAAAKSFHASFYYGDLSRNWSRSNVYERLAGFGRCPGRDADKLRLLHAWSAWLVFGNLL